MSPDAVALLVERLLQDRRTRVDRVRAIVEELRGPQEIPIILEVRPTPAPMPEPQGDPVAPYREALQAMRNERDVLQKRNLELYDELNRLKAELDEARRMSRTPSPVSPELDASLREIGRILSARRDRVPPT